MSVANQELEDRKTAGDTSILSPEALQVWTQVNKKLPELQNEQSQKASVPNQVLEVSIECSLLALVCVLPGNADN